MKSIALFGGLTRLESHYKAEAERFGVAVMLFNEPGTQVAFRMRNADAVVIFTNRVAHSLKIKAVKVAKLRKVPVFCFHTSGIHALRGCLECLESEKERTTIPHPRPA